MMHAIYSWQAAYRSAVLETNPKRLPIRINEARRAIDERLRKSIQIDSPEHIVQTGGTTSLAQSTAGHAR
jgi:hypothetical protein